MHKNLVQCNSSNLLHYIAVCFHYSKRIAGGILPCKHRSLTTRKCCLCNRIERRREEDLCKTLSSWKRKKKKKPRRRNLSIPNLKRLFDTCRQSLCCIDFTRFSWIYSTRIQKKSGGLACNLLDGYGSSSKLYTYDFCFIRRNQLRSFWFFQKRNAFFFYLFFQLPKSQLLYSCLLIVYR